MGWKNRWQNRIFLSSFRFRHCLVRYVVSRATGNRTVACRNSVKPGTPKHNRIACNATIYQHITRNLSKILVPGEVHVDVVRNKDNLLYSHKAL